MLFCTGEKSFSPDDTIPRRNGGAMGRGVMTVPARS
jgi:hypothetical protein